MAFEDRSTMGSPSDGARNSPDSPESSRTSPYTCQVVQEPAPIFRITTYALSDRAPPAQPNSSLAFSIHNILQPDFGQRAVLRTKDPKEKRPSPVEHPPKTDETKLTTPVETPVATPVATQLQQQEQQTVGVDKKSDEPTEKIPTLWPAWVYCTRYSDRPSSGPRSRRMKKPPKSTTPEEKRPRTAFSAAQLARLKHEFTENRYLTERRRQQLSTELGLNEAQIKIWFQNKRAKIKKASGEKNPLALQLMAQGLYNHTTVACDEDDMQITSDGAVV